MICLQAKADEIAKLMHENEQLKSVTEDLKVLESMRKVYFIDEGLIVSHSLRTMFFSFVLILNLNLISSVPWNRGNLMKLKLSLCEKNTIRELQLLRERYVFRF